MYDLYIANKNYSSWSLRPWLLMREMNIDFNEHLLPFGHTSSWEAYRKISPSGKVPCLVENDTPVWDSLAIIEYLAERHPGVWPADGAARTWARCAAAEMHAGFSELRNRCPMNCGVLIRLKQHSHGLTLDMARLNSLWSEGLKRFGGPFLAGKYFTAVDAFYAPVAFRLRSYSLALELPADEYAKHLRGLSGMEEWYAAALQETFRDQPHEDEIHQIGEILEDLRSK